MAGLRKCPFCAEEVRLEAAVCKHCGRDLPVLPPPPPGKFKNPRLTAVAFLGAVVVLAGAFGNNSGTHGSTNVAGADDALAIAKDAVCRENLACSGDKYLIEAAIRCREPIEKIAKYDFKWTDSWTEQKFSRFKWKDGQGGRIIYIGDKIQLQNGYGAYLNHTYTCEYDPISKTVYDVKAAPGRL